MGRRNAVDGEGEMRGCGLNMKEENKLLRGEFRGVKKRGGGVYTGIVHIF
jgi:hypothetical protein